MISSSLNSKLKLTTTLSLLAILLQATADLQSLHDKLGLAEEGWLNMEYF